jgi:hypothetical protein
LCVCEECHRIVRIPEFAFVVSAPDEFARGGDRAVGFLDDFRAATQAVVGELASIRRAGIVDGGESISPVPFERSGEPVIRETAVLIVAQCAIRTDALCASDHHRPPRLAQGGRAFSGPKYPQSLRASINASLL